MASATSFVQGLRKTLARARGIAGRMGLHPYDVALVVDSWSGARAGEGTKTQSVTKLTEDGHPPKVQPVSVHRVAIGLAEVGEHWIGPLTQVQSVSWASLTSSSVTAGKSVKIRLTHRETGEVVYHRIKQVSPGSSALHVVLQTVPVTE